LSEFPYLLMHRLESATKLLLCAALKIQIQCHEADALG